MSQEVWAYQNQTTRPIRLPNLESQDGGRLTVMPGDFVLGSWWERFSRLPGEERRGMRLLVKVPLHEAVGVPLETHPEAMGPPVPCQTSCEAACMSVPETDPHQMEVINQRLNAVPAIPPPPDESAQPPEDRP